MEKLTDKSPLLPLYRTVHEIFTSYGSSFNFFWSHWIRFLVRFENLSPSSIPFRRVTRTNSVTFSCSNWTLSFLLFSKKNIFSFFLPNICGSNHDLLILIRTRNLSRSILLPHSSIIRKILFNQVWIFSFGIRTLLLHFSLLSFFLFFHHSLTPTRFGPVESDPFHHWAKSTKKIRSIFRSKVLCEILGFFLFLYPYLVGRAFESIENPFFCIWMNRYYYIPIPSRYLGTELNPKLTG